MVTNNLKLDPCVFCSYEAALMTNGKAVWAQCIKCSSRGSRVDRDIHGTEKSRGLAVERWNTRYHTSGSCGLVATDAIIDLLHRAKLELAASVETTGDSEPEYSVNARQLVMQINKALAGLPELAKTTTDCSGDVPVHPCIMQLDKLHSALTQLTTDELKGGGWWMDSCTELDKSAFAEAGLKVQDDSAWGGNRFTKSYFCEMEDFNGVHRAHGSTDFYWLKQIHRKDNNFYWGASE